MARKVKRLHSFSKNVSAHRASQADCPFCTAETAVLQNRLAYVRADNFAVSTGHVLVIPFRHVTSFFALTSQERHAVSDLLVKARALLEKKYAPDGYNIGINVGEAAGQTISHVHIHLIPRYRGDVPNPRGGVRGVIPDKQSY